MSKKMLKRSLALGALMAFVITGNAMAADFTFIERGPLHTNILSDEGYDSDTTYDNITIINTTNGEDYGVNMVGKNQQILKASKSITISSTDSGIAARGECYSKCNGSYGDCGVEGHNGKNSELILSAPEIFIKDVEQVGRSGIHLDAVNSKVYIQDFSKFSINTEGVACYGIRINQAGALVEAVGNKNSSITINSSSSGVVMTNNGTVKLQAETIDITSRGERDAEKPYKGQTIANTGGGTIDLTATEKITLTNKNVKNADLYAVYSNNGAINLNTAELEVNGNILADGSNANVNINVTDSMTLTGDKNGAAAVSAKNGAEVSILGNATIKAVSDEGKDAYSLFATGTDSKIVVGQSGKQVSLDGGIISEYGGNVDVVGNNITLNQKGDYGIRAGRNTSDNGVGGTINIDAANKIDIIAGTGIYAGAKGSIINVNSNSINITANMYAGISTKQGAVVNVGSEEKAVESIKILSTSDNGADASGNSKINIFAKQFEIDAAVMGLGIHRGNIKIGSEAQRVENLTITSKTNTLWIKDNNTESDKSAISLFAKNMNLNATNQDGICISNNVYNQYDNGTVVTISATEKLNMTGDVISQEKSSVININEGIDNALVTIDGDITANKGAINLNLGTTGSTLTSTITDNAKGVFLNLNKGTWNVTGASTLNNLESNHGVISFAADADAHIETASGSVVITEDGKTADDLNTAEQLSKVANKLDVTEEASKKLSAKVVMAEGAVKGETTGIVTFADTDNDKYLNGQVLSDPVEKINTTNASINNMLNVALMAWRAENNDMNKRLGELRNANGEHGVWVRMVNGESEYKDVENEYKTYQLGYDEKLSVDPSWTVGAAVSYTEADTTADKASGENKHKGFSVYGSKLNDDGSFVDLIAKVARIEHDFNVVGDKGDWSSNGYSLSAEYGKRLEQGNGLWIEPQVELTYGKISSAECELAGRTVTLEDMESLVGRVGFSLGKDIKQGNVYARASYLYDFEGETTTKFSDGKDTRSFEQDLGGGWWEVGVGANINLSKATYIYADVEKTFGGEVDTNWQWNLGVRYSF